MVSPQFSFDDSPHGASGGVAIKGEYRMLIRIGNFEIDYVFRRRVSVTVGRFQMYCGWERQNPYWRFAKNDPGQPWERWGFGRHLICEMTDGGKAAAGQA